MKYKNTLLMICISAIYLVPNQVFAQAEENKGYKYVLSLDNGMRRKMYVNEFMFDNDEKYLIANYGNKPTYIVVFKVGEWKPIVTFRLSNWVEFTGAYVDDSENIFIKASRFSSDYYKLNIKNKTQMEVPCETTPRGCKVIEPQQTEKTIYSKDYKYMIDINKRNAREARVYIKR